MLLSCDETYVSIFRSGGVIDEIPNALPVPPVCIILKQEIIEVTVADESREEPRRATFLQRDLLAVGSSVCHEKLSIHCFDVTTRTESPSSGK